MKRIITTFLILTMIFSLSACSNKTVKADDKNEKEELEKEEEIVDIKFNIKEAEEFLASENFNIVPDDAKNTEMTKEEIFSSKYLLAPDGSLYILEEDGSFKYYMTYKDQTDNYSSGKYEIFMEEEAVKKISEELGIEESEALETNRDHETKYKLKNLICLVINNEELILDGEKQDASKLKTMVYYGYYFDEYKYFDFMQLDPEKTAGFLKLSETK